MKTEWIKVTDKLPVLWKNVLVQYADGDVLVASLEQYPNGEMNWCYGEGWSDFDEVVSWMPLPDSSVAS